MKPWLRRLAAPVARRVDARVDARVAEQVDSRLGDQREAPAPVADPPPCRNAVVYVPPVDWVQTSTDAAFMEFSTCSSVDVRHPRFAEYCALIGQTPQFHRKQWEFVFVLHHLMEAGMIAPGRRGVGFGVGSEPLPAAFAAAGCEILATDAPLELGEAAGWTATSEHAASLDQLRRPAICADVEFDARVTHRAVDMNDLPADLDGFDFCWSACCFEHLGSLRHGADFVVDSVERCLRPGGVAVHTTELNLSSDDDTYESEALSIYRRRDIVELIDRLEANGHHVQEFRMAPDDFYLDHYVDVPPYHGRPHIKLELAGHVATSVGLVITKAG